MTSQNILERINDLRPIMAKMDPTGRQTWILELHTANGTKSYDIRTGQPIKATQQAQQSKPTGE